LPTRPPRTRTLRSGFKGTCALLDASGEAVVEGAFQITITRDAAGKQEREIARETNGLLGRFLLRFEDGRSVPVTVIHNTGTQAQLRIDAALDLESLADGGAQTP
jgi:UDP-N-acetylmuramyl tripeptide synthase